MALHAREQVILEQARAEGKELRQVDLGSITLDQAQEELGTQSLFGGNTLWHLTGADKLRVSNALKDFLTAVSQLNDPVLLVWASALTPAQQKLFTSPWKSETFAMPKAVFQFTESLKVQPLEKCHQLFRQAVEQGGEWGLHALLARQLRLILAAKVGAPVAAPPFAQAKLKKQAAAFREEQLAGALAELFAIEKRIKSGATPLSLTQQIDRLLVQLYDEGHI